MPAFYGRRGVVAASAAALAVVILGLLLGFWQLRRADEKAELQRGIDRAAAAPPLELTASPLTAPKSLDPAGTAGVAVPPGLPEPTSIDGQRIQVSGTFLAERSIFLDNRTREAVAGFHVLTPLKLTGSNVHVLVLRGWVARDPLERTRLPALITPPQTVQLTGLAVAQLQQPMMLAKEPPPGPGERLWQHFDYPRFARWAGVDVYPMVLRQTEEPEYQDGLARDWNQPGIGVDRHRAYAFQWFAMTAVALGIWLALLWHKWRNRIGSAAAEAR
jgi:surfeit locus 1 family protein